MQEQLLQVTSGAELYFRLGARWAQRHMSDVAAPLLLEALRRDPSLTAAVTYLVVASAEEPALQEALVELAEQTAAGAGSAGSLSYLVASAALVAARDLNNIQRARPLIGGLSGVVSDHPALADLVSGSAEQPAEENSEMTQDPNDIDETSTNAEEAAAE